MRGLGLNINPNRWFKTIIVTAFDLTRVYGEYIGAVQVFSKSDVVESYKVSESKAPIDIALSQDKIDLISLNASKVSFDYSDNGVKARTAWVGQKDAFLIYDNNDIHAIDSVKGLVLTQWSKAAKINSAVLKEVFDSNKDNKFNANDTDFNRFHIWQDKNQDGVSQSGELTSLPEAGLLQIDFDTEQTINGKFFDKQQEMQVAGVSWSNGHQTLAYDLMLEANNPL